MLLFLFLFLPAGDSGVVEFDSLSTDDVAVDVFEFCVDDVVLVVDGGDAVVKSVEHFSA